ncbi:hypothetical protein EKE94_01515 [Mesobaculum littorinae]|uniref:Uncharacterized protein n=1 Tax=Mesobaculum littorinae TaxID=2486419 RepID=A0A438AL46_9RHOB|nr:hypothetical protein EKE94_01515 [Mesobaculum littorinae]
MKLNATRTVIRVAFSFGPSPCLDERRRAGAIFDKILIVHGSDIACRRIWTARPRDIATVAIRSQADARALHVPPASEAVAIGAENAAHIGLAIHAILATASGSGVGHAFGLWSSVRSFRFRRRRSECRRHRPSEAFRTSAIEAAASFGDDRIILKRYVTHPRRTETQTVADEHGACVHPG